MPQAGDRSGDIAEDMAVDFLRLHGYTVLARNYRFGKAEIDVIARMGDTIAFVEVKLREAHTVGASPFEAVGPKKQQQMVKAAVNYAVSRHDRGVNVRFDVIGITWDRSGRSLQLLHLTDAFQADSRYYY